MILTKLQEALVEAATQRKALDEIEMQLRSMIAKLSRLPDAVAPTASVSLRPSIPAIPSEGDRNKLDDVADILRAEGRPLHITHICELLSELKGAKVLRTTVEPGLNRHITKTKMPKIAKFAPSTYGLPEWKQQPQATLGNVA